MSGRGIFESLERECFSLSLSRAQKFLFITCTIFNETHSHKWNFLNIFSEECQQPVLRPRRLSPREPVSWKTWTSHRSHVLAAVADGPAWWNPWWCWLYPGCTSFTSTASIGGSSASYLVEESPRGSYSIFIIKSWVRISRAVYVCVHLPALRAFACR